MTLESTGEITGTHKHYDTVMLEIELDPENSIDPMQVWEWKIGAKVKVIENEL